MSCNITVNSILVIFLVIATVRYDILFDRMIPHALYIDSQPLY